MNRIFSGSVDFSRVNPWGIWIMLAGVFLSIFAERIARHFGSTRLYKIAGLVICAGGALLAILG